MQVSRCVHSSQDFKRMVKHSAGLTIVADVAIATGPAVVCNKSYYIMYKIFVTLRS